MISADARARFEAELGDRIHWDVPMSKHTSLCVGGPADGLAAPANEHELQRVLDLCRQLEIPHEVVGAGFNVLVRDGGVDGIVISLKKLRHVEERPGPAVYSQAGASHSTVTNFCIRRDLAGLEFAAGIPGTVGGWIAMNAGIGTREMVDVVLEVEVLSPDGSERRTWLREDLDFQYRTLRNLRDGSLVLSALFEVHETGQGMVKSEVDRLMAKRSESQPLDVRSCGSVFRNPMGDHAGRLIEAAGLKGETIGGAQISPIHANFIANLGGAQASDVLALIDRARARVRETSGVDLETEVKIIGRAA